MKRLAFRWLALLALALVGVTAGPYASVGVAHAAPPLPARALQRSDFLEAGSTISATGVTTGTVIVTAVDTQAFPDLTAYAAVNDGSGRHISQLPAEAFTLTENSAVIPAVKLAMAEKEVGVQVVFALDTSTPFKTRDANAVTRLDYIRLALSAFGTQQAPPGAEAVSPRLADGIDDVTLLSPEGIVAAHVSQGTELASALSTYTTTFAGAADPLPLVNQALDFASETMPRPGMPRYVVLFSNGILVGGKAVPLTDLVTRAQSAQVAIYTVYVGPGGTSEFVGGQTLQQLAQLTGGRYLVLEKPESLTPLLNYLADQRWQYQLSYRSSLAVTGLQSFSVQVKLPGGGNIASPRAAFPLRVEPPSLTLSSVPPIIELGALGSSSRVISQSVSVAVDFPDGHPRPLRSIELVADGQTVNQLSAPQDASVSLWWNVSGYKSGGSHILLARATDELGLKAESVAVTVMLSFGGPTAQPSPTASSATAAIAVAPARRMTPLVWGGMGLLAMAVVLGGAGLWWWVSRNRSARQTAPRQAVPPQAPLRPPAPAPSPAAQVKPAAREIEKTIPPPAKPAPPLPTTRPLTHPPAHPPAHTFHAPALFPRKPSAPSAKLEGKAYLEVVEGGGGPRRPIEMTSSTLHLGRDAARAEVVFQERSVSRLHARIVEAPEGVFRIYDEGSTSGTWVNFTQIPAEGGWELKSGDLINLGRIQLRFKQRAPAPPLTGPGEPDSPAPYDGVTEPFRPAKK